MDIKLNKIEILIRNNQNIVRGIINNTKLSEISFDGVKDNNNNNRNNEGVLTPMLINNLL